MATVDIKKARAAEHRYRYSAKGKAAHARKREKIRQGDAYRESERLRASRRREADRLQALIAYGGSSPKCQCECGCGESKAIYLDLDHVNNDGSDHRRKLRAKGGDKFYAALKRAGWPKDPPIRVLCVKCNVGRHRNLGQCPELGIVARFEGRKTLRRLVSPFCAIRSPSLFDGAESEAAPPPG